MGIADSGACRNAGPLPPVDRLSLKQMIYSVLKGMEGSIDQDTVSLQPLRSSHLSLENEWLAEEKRVRKNGSS